ncbi:TetR family transcriptional regulator [Sediminihabitans luteus]|uniref:TetR family transcriptional regulator n=1 Tax=Sediminihabitans luteus TaxID=1138585 RepID=A0A2M9CC65_9CELL|nr:TetR family transcriptional regulator [Sediminihabitans luteus]PJJ68972.1 TetR family transcriptional regulator [Sediminihabitans luteus]GII99355.1 TetR family transcriptional regulator [Sediminihabitans luteus]
MQRTDRAPGLRERKKAQRREALVAATHDLVRERGLDNVTVDEICAAVGVSTRTFFNYFPSKDDAVLGNSRQEIPDAASLEFVQGGPTGDLVTDIGHLLVVALDVPVLSTERLADVYDVVSREPRLLAHQMAWMEQQRVTYQELLEARRDVVPSPHDPELVALVLTGLIRAAFTRWHHAGGNGPPSAFVAEVVAECRALLAPDQAP